jgi:hypothetical protein
MRMHQYRRPGGGELCGYYSHIVLDFAVYYPSISSGASSEPEGSLQGTVFIVKLDEMYFCRTVDTKTLSRNKSPLITWELMEERGSLYRI